MFALTLHNTVIQYKNDLQKAAKINVTLRYPLEIIYVLYKTSQKEYEKIILSCLILNWLIHLVAKAELPKLIQDI